MNVFRGSRALAYAGTVPPANRGVIVVTAGVGSKFARIVMWTEAGSLGIVSKRKLQQAHSRETEFLAQPFYPPGINGTSPGPLFGEQQSLFLDKPTPPCFPNGNGITAFPGATPLYKSGMLVGGLGISGDGVDQDDYVTNAGAAGYLPDPSIRADQIIFRGTALPFFKFPRHPGL